MTDEELLALVERHGKHRRQAGALVHQEVDARADDAAAEKALFEVRLEVEQRLAELEELYTKIEKYGNRRHTEGFFGDAGPSSEGGYKDAKRFAEALWVEIKGALSR